MDLQRAKELLSGLADGVDPLTGEVLPEDHVCNKAEIIRAFHCVLKSLPGKASKPQPENAGKPWNDADDAVLCQMFDAGGSKKEMCAYFKRSEGSLAARLASIEKLNSGWMGSRAEVNLAKSTRKQLLQTLQQLLTRPQR